MLKTNFLLRPMTGQSTILGTVSDYIALTKPPIVLLLLVTAVSAMFLAAGGPPPLAVALLLVAAGAAAAGGAGAINQYMDRDIDYIMNRTRQRPLPGRRISPVSALVFGVALNIFAFIVLAVGVNLLSAALTLTGALFYVFVYTWWLKRTTPQNIVIGGAAGAVPPLAGWAAVTGGLDAPAFYLFAIIFLWTPPHFWALALLMKEEYSRAGIPMLPVVKGTPATQRGILLYTLATVAVSLAFYFTTEALGRVYLGGAAASGAVFVYLAWKMAVKKPATDGRVPGSKRLYLYSLLYLAVVFIFVMVDSMVNL